MLNYSKLTYTKSEQLSSLLRALLGSKTRCSVPIQVLFIHSKNFRLNWIGKDNDGLQHTHCTTLLNSGLNVKVIIERLGNTPKRS